MGQVAVFKVSESPARLTLRINLLGDGTGELKNYVILAPSDLNPPFPNRSPAFRIMQIWAGLVWFDVTFQTGTLIPSPLWTFARDCDSRVDFTEVGGLVDTNVYNSPPSDDDGKLTITTNNFVAGSRGSILLSLIKTNQVSG